ncbi:MAG: hypothetical protein K0T53_03855 [Wolbachia pipientis]|nr:hypothetical protein [Wolbachia pipientis]
MVGFRVCRSNVISHAYTSTLLIIQFLVLARLDEEWYNDLDQ